MTWQASIVQFPHPGRESRVERGTEVVPWNTGDHGRKFMQSHGTLYESTGFGAFRGDLVFWGEWEAGSEIRASWQPEWPLPTYLHRPVVGVVPDGFRQNTDPFVFGQAFKYAICRQLRNRKLQALLPGSLILFGSTVAGQFVLDTLFVCASSRMYRPSEYVADESDHDDQVFAHVTPESLSASFPSDRATFALFSGATPASPVNGMFSFVPAREYGDGSTCRFARPVIRLDGRVNPRNFRSSKGAGVLLPAERVVDLWHSVVNQIEEQGLGLGAGLELPTNPPEAGVAKASAPTATG